MEVHRVGRRVVAELRAHGEDDLAGAGIDEAEARHLEARAVPHLWVLVGQLELRQAENLEAQHRPRLGVLDDEDEVAAVGDEPLPVGEPVRDGAEGQAVQGVPPRVDRQMQGREVTASGRSMWVVSLITM